MVLPSRRAYHVIYDDTLQESLNYAADNNWTGIVPDISVPRFSPHLHSEKDRDRLRRSSEELSIEWGFHAPGDDVNLFVTYPHIRTGILEYFKSIIDFARDVSWKSTNLVLHAGVIPQFRKPRSMSDEFVESHQDTYQRALSEILTELMDYGCPDVDIVLENYKWTTIAHEVIRILVPRGLKLCMDIPKLYNSDLSLLKSDWNLFKQHLDSIEVVHLHDWAQEFGSHQVIGTGLIDFSESLTLLGSISRGLQYVIEVRPREDAQDSLSNLEILLKRYGIILE